MTSANRQLNIAFRKGLLTSDPCTFEELIESQQAIVRFNLVHLQAEFNRRIEALGYTYFQGWVKD